MALPITVPFTFGNATTTQSLSSLDADFSTVYNAVNGIGNGTVSLANVSITGGTISANITSSSISSGTSNVAITSSNGNVTAYTNGNLAMTIDSNLNATFGGTVVMASSFLRNRIINGDMRIDQRNAGASVTPTTSGYYSCDRWQSVVTQTSKYSLQQNAGSVTPPVGFPNYLGVTSLSAYSVAAGDVFAIAQKIEGFNISDLNWGTANAKTVTLSAWVRSSLTGTFGGALQNSDGTRNYPFSYSIPVANTWTSISVTIAGDITGPWNATNSSGIGINFGLGAGSTYSGTAGAWTATNAYSATGAVSVVGTNGATFYITGVQLEVGSNATPFERRLYGTELMLCQRYYTTYTVNFRSYCLNGDYVSNPIYYSTQMRTAPTAARSGGTFTNCSFAIIEYTNVGMTRYTIQATSSTMVQVVNDVATFSAEI
jgi:hypothetical protein